MFSEYCQSCPHKQQCFDECDCILVRDSDEDLRYQCKGLMGLAELSGLVDESNEFVILAENEPDDDFFDSGEI